MSFRDAAGGYGTSMHRVRMTMRANTPFGDRDEGDELDVAPSDAEWMTKLGIAELVEEKPAPAPARARRGVRGEQRMVRSGDHTRSVEPS